MGLLNYGRLPRWFDTVGVSGGHPPLVLELSEEGCLDNGHQILGFLQESGQLLHLQLLESILWESTYGPRGVARSLGVFLSDFDIFWWLMVLLICG